LGSNGQLSICYALPPTEENVTVKLATYVEQCWIANYSSKGENDLDNTLWAYGEFGLQVWFPFSYGSELQPTKLMSRDKYLEFDLEVYPVGTLSVYNEILISTGFIPHLGVIVGVTQEVVHNFSSSYPCFELNIKVSIWTCDL
jgi:hypothetical protein